MDKQDAQDFCFLSCQSCASMLKKGFEILCVSVLKMAAGTGQWGLDTHFRENGNSRSGSTDSAPENAFPVPIGRRFPGDRKRFPRGRHGFGWPYAHHPPRRIVSSPQGKAAIFMRLGVTMFHGGLLFINARVGAFAFGALPNRSVKVNRSR